MGYITKGILLTEPLPDECLFCRFKVKQVTVSPYEVSPHEYVNVDSYGKNKIVLCTSNIFI